jgi:riboflavin synthase alpha subunit
MFTGLIESVATLTAVSRIPDGVRLEVSSPWVTGVQVGESVAVNGVCLTVVAAVDGRLSMDVGPETLRATTLGRLTSGRKVNLERALKVGDRLGGHFVQGHVDGTGELLDIRPSSDFTWLTFSYPLEHDAWIIPKGAMAVDGISLTVASLARARFDVQIVPFTWEHTALPELRVGDAVNLEFDILGKYAVRAAQLSAGQAPVPTDAAWP